MKKLLVSLTAAVIALSCVACGNSEELEALRKENEELKQQIIQLQATPEPTQAPQVTPGTVYEFSAGKYEVGVDIPPGKYDLKWLDGWGQCYIASKNDEWVLNEHMANDEWSITEYNNVILEPEIIIDISGDLEVSFTAK